MSSSSPRCSVVTQALGVDPVGTAGSYDVFVLVEHPLPWPRDIGDDPAIAAISAAIEAAAAGGDRRVRIQALVPRGNRAERRRVLVYERPAAGFVGYRRREATAPAEDVADLVVDMLSGGGSAIATDVIGLQDVLICTHGRRDVCCGTLGTTLWKELEERLHVLGPSVRLWRTSHTRAGARVDTTSKSPSPGWCPSPTAVRPSRLPRSLRLS